MNFIPLSPETEAARNAFRTHANYVEAFYRLLDRREVADDRVTLPKHIYDRIIQSGVCNGKPRADINEDTLRKSLSHAWGIELLLYASQEAIDDDTVIRLANNWACIQAYYIFYHSTQALLVAKGHVRPETHEKTQKVFLNLWTERSSMLEPWSLIFGHDGVRGNLTNEPVDLGIQNLKHCDSTNCWSLAAKALKTTREKHLEEAITNKRKDKKRERIKAWEETERVCVSAGKRQHKRPVFRQPKLTAEEKVDVGSRLRPCSLMDYLYRLRIKSNYEDADMFTEGPWDTKQSAVFYRHLCALASATLFLTELSVMPIWGKAKFLTYRDGWMKSRAHKVTQQELLNRTSFLHCHTI